MTLNKQTKIFLGILTGITTLTMCVLLFMGAFFVNDTLEPYFERPGLYEIRSKLKKEHVPEKRIKLRDHAGKLKERELSIFEKAYYIFTRGKQIQKHPQTI